MKKQSQKSAFQRIIAVLLLVCVVATSASSYNFAVSAETQAVDAPETADADTVVTDSGVIDAGVEGLATQADTFFDKVKIFSDGIETSCEELNPEEHLNLSAQYVGEEEASYLWQIYSPKEELWIDIDGADESRLQVGYALLMGMLDEDGVALIICKATVGDMTYYSQSLQILVHTPEDVPLVASVVPAFEMSLTEEGSAMSASEKSLTEEVSALPSSVMSLEAEEDGDTNAADIGIMSFATGDDVAGGELITHTVTVEYLYHNGATAAQPYVATVKHKDAAELKVHPDCPIKIGYTPYIMTVDGRVDGTPVTEDAPGAVQVYTDDKGNPLYGIHKNKLELDLSNIDQDITYRVVYYPNKVTYTVSHYVQNIVNDDYVLYYVETKEGYVGATTDATDLTRETIDDIHLQEGFIALVPFDNEEIAADGTTQINAYYDRIYYLMTVKLDGGHGAQPVYARYGAPVMIDDPKKTGYTFDGWDRLLMNEITGHPARDEQDAYIVEAENADIPDTMPGKNTAYLARWAAAKSKYTVVYWQEKAEPVIDGNVGNDYDYWHSKTLENVTTDSLILEEDIKDPSAPHIDVLDKVTTSSYIKYDVTDATDLSGKSFALKNQRQGKYLTTEATTVDGQSALKEGTFVDGEKATEWEFVKSGSSYKIKSGTSYLKMSSSGSLTLVTDVASASNFTVEARGDGSTWISSTANNVTQYISDYWGGSADGYRGYNVKNDVGNYFELCFCETKTEVDPEFNFFYFDHSDVEADTVATADGTTLINVYYKRKEYNLRFFYARKNASGTYQYWSYYIDSFCTNQTSSADNIDYLLTDTLTGHWTNFPDGVTPSDVAKPTNTEIKTGEYLNTRDNCTYYYLTFTAKYGTDIRNLWPSESLEEIPGSGRVFSAWGGESWMQYSRSHSNITIKGLQTKLDSRLLYDKSYGPNYSDMGTNKEVAKNDGYLDFFAYWESNPGQFIYYVWKEAVHYDPSNPEDGDLLTTTLPTTTYDAKNGMDYGATPEKTVYFDSSNNTYYRLHRIVNMCDNAGNGPSTQTYPTLIGYSFREETLSSSTGWAAGTKFYENTSYDTSIYKESHSLNYMYDADKYTITLQSHNYVKDIDNVPYGSMDGAKIVLSNYDYEAMMNTYYPVDLPEGAYTFGGWYKDPEHLEASKADLTRPMPNYNIMLYAKWIPKSFHVSVYQTSEKNTLVYYDDNVTDDTVAVPMQWTVTEDDETGGLVYGSLLPESVEPAGPDKTVYTDTEGNITGARILENMSPKDVTGGKGEIRSKWIFVCYAYMKDGVEYALDTGSFTVQEDVDIYAKWTASDIVAYEIRYAEANLEVDPEGNFWAYRPDGNGGYLFETVAFNPAGKLAYADGEEWVPDARKVMVDDEVKELYIADPVRGNQNEGANRTFEAKMGLELYEQYQDIGFFPIHASHTVMMVPGPNDEGTEGHDPIVHTFYYIRMSHVQYTVRYWDAYGNPMADADGDGDIDRDDIPGKTILSEKAVVTENYVFYPGYVADSFQKTMILSANPAENIMTFHYSKSENESPYTIIYYYQTLGDVYDEQVDDLDDKGNKKKYLEYTTVNGSASNQVGTQLEVDYLSIMGYEYVKDVKTKYISTDLSNTSVETQMRAHVELAGLTATQSNPIIFQDMKGDPAYLYYNAGDSKNYTITCSSGHDYHSLVESTYTYTYMGSDGVERTSEVRDITVNADNTITLTVYETPGSSFTTDIGRTTEDAEYGGTVIKVYYDLKYYPYYVFHIVEGETEAENETIEIETGKAQFQDTMERTSWTTDRLIEHDPSYAGYGVDVSDKTITITMTIQDDSESPRINVMNFYYYEQNMEYLYEAKLLKNPDTSSREVVDMDDPNAKLSITRDYIKVVSGQTDTAKPILYEEAYEFVGWYEDAECTKPVANGDYYAFVGLTAPTTDAAVIKSQSGLNPVKSETITYSKTVTVDGEEVTQVVKDYKVTNPLYLGVDTTGNGDYQMQQKFYALFAPKLGTLTIHRTNMEQDCGHNEANSFIYTIVQTKDESGNAITSNPLTMQVTINPREDSVVITNLPFGTYEVIQENDWSWRYSDASQNVGIHNASPYQTVDFGGGGKTTWLSGFAETIKNIFE